MEKVAKKVVAIDAAVEKEEMHSVILTTQQQST